MKILKLTAENIKKLVVVEISPEGNLIQITGNNGNGKTSVLDSIWWALAGTEHIQGEPIRKDADKARIELVLGDGQTVALIVERTFTEKGSYLSVKTADGAKYPSPQKMLDDILGALSLDPLEFMRAGGARQFAILKRLVPLGVDLEIMAEADKQDYERRTTLNRGAKDARAKAASIVVPEGLPETRLDEQDALYAIERAATFNAKREADIGRRAEAASRILDSANEASRLRLRAAALIDEAVDIETKVEMQEAEMAALPDLQEVIDVSGLRKVYESARAINAGIESRDARAKEEKQASYLEAAAKELTERMEARAKQRADALAAASMPIEGLSFGDGTVIFNALPLDQASDAEQLKVSMAIAMALNPTLRVIRVRDGSLLDGNAMKWLAEIADSKDFQIWVERCDGSGSVGIVMEDGYVRGAKAADATKSEKGAETSTENPAAFEPETKGSLL